MKDKKYEIIDCHVHTFPDAIAKKAIDKLAVISGIIPSTEGTLEDTLSKMKDFSVDRIVLLNIATSKSQQETINNVASEINKSNDKVISFGSVHQDAEDALQELERIKSLGIKGIKLHPDYQGFMIDDKKLFPIYDCCSQLSLPVVFHAGWDCYSPELVHAPPHLSANILKNFPKLKVILAHFGGLRLWDEVNEHLIGKNAFFDTAMCATYCEKSVFEKMVNRHDSNKILFGSDCPWENPSATIEYIESTSLSDDVKEKIFSKNVKNLLNIV